MIVAKDAEIDHLSGGILEASHEIARLQAEIVDLKADRDSWLDQAADAQKTAAEKIRENDRLVRMLAEEYQKIEGLGWVRTLHGYQDFSIESLERRIREDLKNEA